MMTMTKCITFFINKFKTKLLCERRMYGRVLIQSLVQQDYIFGSTHYAVLVKIIGTPKF